MTLEQILFYSTKSLGIAYVTTLQFSYAIGVNLFLDKYFDYENNNTTNTNDTIFYDFIYLCVIIGCLAILSFIGRHIIKQIPSPFHLINGFDYNKLKEVYDTSAITGFMLLTSGIINSRINHLRKIYKINH